ncbi:FkbM family methyltransferase [uncultured Winogradskyella sp.]|uniref:FkbM family methyltransferase n=1 Tax=uncultured Winogradskyella sp. TaxID=395353 RepID=UPI002629F87F|nr:FkbM family methyltransferase [uncultured Winogradskyella sp.]
MSKLKYFFKNLKSQKRKKIFGEHAKGIIYESQNGVIALPIEDITIGKSLGFKGHWDINEANKIKDKCSEDDIVYVIGTHVGTLLIPLAKKVKQIIGYEANENTHWYAEKNLDLNDTKNVTIYNYAVGNENKEVEFYQSTVNTGGSKIKPIKEAAQYTYDNPKTVKVDMVVLDEHIKQQNLPEPTGFIMDIEGAEYFALQGMQESLKKVKFLYVEYVPHHLENVSNVSKEVFMELILPHFKTASFIKRNKTFSLENESNEFFDYLNELQLNDKAEDILFE